MVNVILCEKWAMGSHPRTGSHVMLLAMVTLRTSVETGVFILTKSIPIPSDGLIALAFWAASMISMLFYLKNKKRSPR